MQRKGLAVAFLVLLAASELPQPAESWSFSFSYNVFNLGREFKRQIQGFKNWFLRAEKWWIVLGNKMVYKLHPFMNERDFRKWYYHLKIFLNAPYTDRNPWVRCAKASWPHCIARNGGLHNFLFVWCPWVLFMECQQAYLMGRRPYDTTDPYWDVTNLRITRLPHRRLLQQ